MELPLPYLLVPLAVLVFAGLLAVVAVRRGRARVRLGVGDPTLDGDADEEESIGGLAGWLARAGYRSPGAPLLFIVATFATLGLGLLVGSIASALGVFDFLALGLERIPGDFAGVFAPLLKAGPVLLCCTIVIAPLLYVRGRRREIVEAVERDLPVVLELLATLAQAGMGFDSAVARLVGTEQGSGIVGQEFRTFQRETLSGVPRVRCLRRMADRIDVPTFSTFVSSLVQAERSGFGLSDVLRHQAEDLRNRRREAALMRAQALPVKLVFPLVICFLPGLFVLTLGPAFFEFAQRVDAVTRTLR